MPSWPETADAARPRGLERLNARLHYYAGLYFLFFVWLFALTGLLLNHGTWGMAAMPRDRAKATSEHRVTLPAAGTPLADAQDLMRQLGLEGEIQWLGTTPDAARFSFRVARPGRHAEVRVDLGTSTAVVERTASDALGVARAVHLFTGVRLNDARNERDWRVTQLWAFAMDAVALGLLVMVGSGIVIWWRSGRARVAGLLAVGAGLVCCVWFVAGIASFAS